MSTERGLTLWQIDETLHSLLLMRDEEGISAEEREAIDSQVRVWVEAQLSKVDRVAQYLRHAKMMEEQAEAESRRYAVIASTWENRVRRLKEMCLALMEERGLKRLEGNGNTLREQANGGKRALKITREDLVPDEFCSMQGCIPLFIWRPLIRLAYEVGTKEMQRDLEGLKLTRVVNESAVRKALESKCPACQGDSVTDADLVECQTCGGTGHQLVPGAELEDRGSHLRVE